jgi:hypothetical protein
MLVLVAVLAACTPTDENGVPVPGKDTFEFEYELHVKEITQTVDVAVFATWSSEIYDVEVFTPTVGVE